MSSISCLYGHEPLGSKEPYMLYNEQMQNLPESIKKAIMKSWNHKKKYRWAHTNQNHHEKKGRKLEKLTF